MNIFRELSNLDTNNLWGIVLFISIVCIVNIVIGYTRMKKTSKECEEYKDAAYKDILTKIPNRASFLSDINKKIKEGKPFSLMFIDLDGFKAVNDNLGHDAGDVLLIKVANDTMNLLSEPSKAYRLGGDEFAVIYTQFEDKEDILDKAKEVQEAIQKIDEIDGSEIKIDCSMGIAIYKENGTTKDELLVAADNAMYHIKENGKGSIYFFTKGLEEKLNNERDIKKGLEEGLTKGQFNVAYRLREDTKNIEGSVRYVDTTLRWEHPLLGTISPRFFLDIAKKSGIIIDLEEFVLKETMGLIEELENKGIDNIGFCVKMTMKHFKSPEYKNNIKEIIEKSGAKNPKILIEITDNIDVNNIEILKMAIDNELKGINSIKFIIDNIIIREETINLIKTLPVKEVKVDKTFIDNIEKHSEFVKNTVRMIHSINLQAMVLSIDTKEKHDMVKMLGFDIFEGDYISSPLNRFELQKELK